MTPLIRPYKAQDRAACAAVFYRAVREGAAEQYSPEQRAAWAPADKADTATPDRLLDQHCWVAEQNGQITGFMSLTPSGYLDMAFVLPEAKGKGVADALYRALMTRAKQDKIENLTVHASHGARHFFEKHGWQVDHQENHPVNGQTLERFQMSLIPKDNKHD
jgi:putative acetyltransferase